MVSIQIQWFKSPFENNKNSFSPFTHSLTKLVIQTWEKILFLIISYKILKKNQFGLQLNGRREGNLDVLGPVWVKKAH